MNADCIRNGDEQMEHSVQEIVMFVEMFGNVCQAFPTLSITEHHYPSRYACVMEPVCVCALFC